MAQDVTSTRPLVNCVQNSGEYGPEPQDSQHERVYNIVEPHHYIVAL